jgi:hypothetical protein
MVHDVIDSHGPDGDARIAARQTAGPVPASPGGHDRAQALLDLLRDDADLAAARHELLARMHQTMPFVAPSQEAPC